MNLRRAYAQLLKRYGPQGWWPAQARGHEARCLEICLGAILTQSTNWRNVEQALAALRRAHTLSLERILVMPRGDLARLIRPSGYYNQKALKLQAFAAFVRTRYGGRFRAMFREPTMALRLQLLDVHGLGPETADSILLYAGAKPIFVIDAYTRRWLAERGLTFRTYDEYRRYFEQRFPRNVKRYQEFHALLVAWGKDQAKRKDRG